MDTYFAAKSSEWIGGVFIYLLVFAESSVMSTAFFKVVDLNQHC